ncbi:MAG: isoaspartyl peptidase/L-asparaginase [Acidobacteria bacterium]|jgi:beta-aspartyl-peptidase (threonine type)|nr:isoaspartyl peptidase/L-asparaginase [Acidobacteriota bacterium]
MKKSALAIHGGAGTILKSLMTDELEKEYRNGLETALKAGWKILQNGGNALNAVEASVIELENNPLFNAGKGAVFTHDEKNEMDACIMDGKTHNSGAVAFVRNVKNPIKLARLVMEETEHYFLAGIGANEFAKEMNVEFAPDEYFFTDFRYQQLLEARAKGVVQLDHAPTVQSSKFKVQSQSEIPDSRSQIPALEIENSKSKAQSLINPKSKIQNPKSKIGTAGAVACDSFGNLAAATSTGGMTNKKFGRIGDTPIIGAGTYADDKTCAVSGTGHGEFFMQTVAAYDVACRMKYKNLSLVEAANETVEYLREIGGEGGLIAVDALGNVALPFNSEGMYRGSITSDGKTMIEIY